ncbi:MAG: 2-isopropylmalate synthase [Thermoprotei archaeon]|nr:MAG: 2-isopropylmalate synthase [Thermoprotei archaeon]RLF19929.1 MAG: 2-isopropylmalate synthase [Thermoprotei archaeon]
MDTSLDDLSSSSYDVHAPRLFKNIFPFVKPPRVVIDYMAPMPDLPSEIFLTDTTFRDGVQAFRPYSREEILTLFEYLALLSGDKGVIRWTEFFLYSSRDRAVVQELLDMDYKYPKVTGWIRATLDDLRLVKEVGLDETGILTSISDYHIFYKLNMTRDKALRKYLMVVEEALKSGIIPRCHLEDITRADIYGCVVPFVKELMKLSEHYGIPVKIRLSDTLGLGLPFPFTSLPRSIPKIIHVLKYHCGVPSECIEFHGHNDFSLAVANSLSAWLYGASAVNCTLLGIGERAGNTPLEVMLVFYVQITEDDLDLKVITDIAKYYREKIGYRIAEEAPIVGNKVFSTAAGIHADGLLKNPEVYLPFDPERVLGRRPGIFINDRSGRAGIALWINFYFGLRGKNQISKDHPAVDRLYRAIMESYEKGRTSIYTDEELLDLMKKYTPELFRTLISQCNAVQRGVIHGYDASREDNKP